jgi:hypothetical protein
MQTDSTEASILTGSRVVQVGQGSCEGRRLGLGDGPPSELHGLERRPEGDVLLVHSTGHVMRGSCGREHGRGYTWVVAGVGGEGREGGIERVRERERGRKREGGREREEEGGREREGGGGRKGWEE